MAGGELVSWPGLRRLWRLLLLWVCFNGPGLGEAEVGELVSTLLSGSLSSPLDLSRWRRESAIALRERLCLCLRDSGMSVQIVCKIRTLCTVGTVCYCFKGCRLRTDISRQ